MVETLSVPDSFAADLVRREGEAGRRWLGSVPATIAELCCAWGLEPVGRPQHGAWGLVFEVLGNDAPAVLKVSYPDPGQPLENVVTALSLWDGRGAVQLLRHDLERCALLLERLDAGRSLRAVPMAEALVVAGDLLRRLAVPAPETLPRIETVAKNIAQNLNRRWERLGKPMPRRTLERTFDLISAFAPASPDLVVNWDLHYEDVLVAEREPWLAVDPAVLSGDPAWGLAQLLWWPLEEIEAAGGVVWALDRLGSAADLDPQRSYAWTYVRTVDYWLMGLEHGLTIDPARCERIVGALERTK
jgi:streptomycin 6-kinase